MSRPGQDRLGHAVETALFAPLGFGLYLRDMGPAMVQMLVARGRAEVDRRQEQVEVRLHSARSLGQVLVAFGVPELRRRASSQLETARERAQGSLASLGALGAALVAPEPVPPAPPMPTAPPAPTANGAGPPRGDSGHLAIPGYDALSASQVVERLAGLADAELAAVRDYEATHRNRRTILGKIEQLAR
jgi:hypothetical protein